MRGKFFFIITLLFSAPARSQTIVTDVTIVDVENSRLIDHQSVLLDGNLIKTIGPVGQIKTPPHTKTISGTSKYLMPGMIDGHAHSLTDGSLYSDPGVIDLTKYVSYEKQLAASKVKIQDHYKRFLQSGITTVIDPGSTYNILKIHDSLSKGTLLPTVFMAGPLITVSDFGPGFGSDPKDVFFMYAENPEAAKLRVQEQLKYHPAYIKIIFVPDLTWQHIEDSARKKLPVVKAIIDEAHKNNLKVAVHATERITAQLAVEAGCDYLVHGVHDEIIRNDFIDLLKRKNISFCPTANVEFPFYRVFTQQAGYSEYEIKHADPLSLSSLFDLQDLDTALFMQYKKKWSSSKSLWRRDSIRLINLKKLSDEGINIVSGTDASSFGDLQAASYLPELLKMKESGMSNWSIIKASTIDPTYFLNNTKSTGSIATGKIADMILLNKNPTEDLNNLTDIALIFKNGIAISPDTLIKETPELLIQRLLNSYNGKNQEAFLECFDKNVKIYDFPNSLLYQGVANLKTNYAPTFAKGSTAHCQLLNRIVAGNTVIDKVVMKKDYTIANQLTILYKIRNNKIVTVYFIR